MPPRRHDQGDRRKEAPRQPPRWLSEPITRRRNALPRQQSRLRRLRRTGLRCLPASGSPLRRRPKRRLKRRQAQQQPTRSQLWLVQRRQSQRRPRPQPLRRLQRRRTQANQPSSGGPMLELTTNKHGNDHTKREHDLTRLRREPFHVRATRACTPPLVTSSSTGGSCQQVSINICVIVLTLTN